MLETLTIQNFQSHSKLLVEFDPGITTIVGPSDVGKSAVLRALWWVITNTPAGGAFVQHGTKGATVRLEVDGQVIVRRRGKDINTYGLNGAELKAFGAGVPAPVADVLNVGPVNFQDQHDPPFWFKDTPGAVSRQLNAIIDLGIIDEALAEMVGKLTYARTRANVALDHLREQRAKRDGLKWVADAHEELVAVEAAHTISQRAAVRAATVQAIILHAQSYQALRDRATRANVAARNVLGLCQVAGKAGKAAKVMEAAIGNATRYRAAAAVYVPDVAAVTRCHNAALVAHDNKTAEANRAVRFARKITEANVASKLVEVTTAAATKAHAAFHAVQKEACPLCGRTD